jgi:2-oxoglutarate ferredoxin oxidoreductase subunit alpha
MARRMPQVGGTFLQAESEIAAINMVYGTSAAGKRTMTSSSSPGIALKSEGLSYLAGSDLPAFVVNIQRGGPGLAASSPPRRIIFRRRVGRPRRFPDDCTGTDSVQEMVDLTFKGFDLADQYRMTSMLLADGVLGQMMEPVSLHEMAPNERKSPGQ